MNLLNLLTCLIFSYGSLGHETGEKSRNGNEEIYFGGFRNYYFTPNPTDYSELLSSEEFEKDFLEKSVENDINILFESDLSERHDLSDLIPLSDASARKFLLDQSNEAEQNLTFDYGYPESEPNQVFIRRQVNNMENSDEKKNVMHNINSPYFKKNSPNNHTHHFNKNFPPSTKNGSFTENHQMAPSWDNQNGNPLFRERQDQNKGTGQAFGFNEDNLNTEVMVGRLKRKKNQKKSPCKMYLQFLKYAFKELDKNSEYYDEVEDEYNDWEADGSRQVFSTQLLGPTLYIDNSGRVFQLNSQGNSIQSVDRYMPTSRDTEKNFIGQNFLTTNSPTLEHKAETAPAQPIYNSFILSYDRLPEIMNKNSESPASDEFTNLPTIPTEATKEATITESPFLLMTTPFPSNLPNLEDFQRKSGLPKFFNPNSNYSSAGAPAYLQRLKNSTSPKDENQIQVNTTVSFDKKPQDTKEPDCNDKMLPCPDTFNVTYPLNGYCNRYVSCESGAAIRRTCEHGYHFNVVTKSCDLPHNSICSYFCPEPSGHFGIPGDCSGYFICKNSIAEYRMCPPRMHWEVKTSTCTFADLSSCPMKCSTPNEIKPYKGDCKAYIICHNGVPFYHKCPSKLVFNGETQTCVPENLYSCKNNPRLITKNINPSHLCQNIDDKLGENSWCNNYNS